MHEKNRNSQLLSSSAAAKRSRSASNDSEGSHSSLNLVRMRSNDTAVSRARSLPVALGKNKTKEEFEDFDLFSPTWTTEALAQDKPYFSTTTTRNIQQALTHLTSGESSGLLEETRKSAASSPLISKSPLPMHSTLAWPGCVISKDIPVNPRVIEAFGNGEFLFSPLRQLFSKGTASVDQTLDQHFASIKTPSMDEALRLIAKFEATLANFGVLALDVTAKSAQDFYLAQNYKSVRFLGEVSKNMSNQTIRALIPESVAVHFLRHAFYCVHHASGQELIFSCRVNLLAGETLLKLSMCFENGVLLVAGYVG